MNSKLLMPEVLEGIRGRYPELTASDEEISDASYMFAAQAVSISMQPEAALVAAMGPSALLVYIANTYANAFLPGLIKEGVISTERASSMTRDMYDKVDKGASKEEIGKALWGE